MTVFLHAIETKQDGESVIRQMKAAKAMGIARVGVYDRSTTATGYDSASYSISRALQIVEKYIVKM